MRRFELTEDLITGLADIDEDHREIFAIGNRINSPEFMDSDRQTMEDTLEYLDDYINYHFIAEEYGMSKEGYPGLENHSRRHREFHKEISNYVDSGRRNGISKGLILKISFAIEKWFLEHIRVADRGFAFFLQRNKIPEVRLPGVRTLKDAEKLPVNFNERIVSGRNR